MNPSLRQPEDHLAKILVVEDEALIAEEIADRLSRLSYNVTGIADTGPKALAQVRRETPDLVLMDIRLKGAQDGIQTASLITSEFDVPIIYLTAHSDEATLSRAKGTAPHGYILKPFQERDLVTIEMTIHRHALEKRLKQSELRYATTLESIGDGVVAADLEGRITFINPIACALTLWSEREAIGAHLGDVMVVRHEVSGQGIESPGLRALRTRTKVTYEEPIILVARDGSLIPIDDCAAPIIEKNGRTTGVVVAFRDVRQRRLTESSLREAEAQLRHAQKMEAVGRLAGGIAHDFSNLLTIIGGSTEQLLQAEVLDIESRALLDEVSAATERASALTRQLLSFSRKQSMQLAVFDLNEMVSNLHRMLLRVIGEHIRLVLDLSAQPQIVRADPQQLEQVLMNLAINARDAMPEGGRLAIRTERAPQGGSFRPLVESSDEPFVCLIVEDTGEGMPHDVAVRAFEPFFTTKGQDKGTGLGLATAHGIVAQSGGVIELESRVGQGTTFHVYLPIVDEPVSSRADGRKLVPRGGETILLADDDDGVRTVAANALSRYGYRVLTAHDGLEALAIFRARSSEINLLVADVVMPGASGRRLADSILQLRSSLPVLFISGYTDETLVEHGVESGVAHFLQKPFSGTELARKVREIIDLVSVGGR